MLDREASLEPLLPKCNQILDSSIYEKFFVEESNTDLISSGLALVLSESLTKYVGSAFGIFLTA